MRRHAHGGGLLTRRLGAVLVFLAAGCSRGVDVAPPEGLTSTASAICHAVRWPQKVGELERIPTVPDSPLTAAWGDPAVIARCGLPAPEPTTEECVRVDGVDWVAHSLSDGTRLTTYGRDPAIEVLVPKDYGPAPLLLPAFDDAAERLPRTGRTCE